MNKRYWLRGGLILCVIVVVFSVALIPFGNSGGHPSFPYWFILFLPGFFISHNISFLSSLMVGIMVGLFLYFLIGLGLGWFYGKIKNRNKIN